MPMHWFDNAIQLPNGIMCYRHRVMFVEFTANRDCRHVPMTSRGCPVCVGLIRAEVQRDMKAAAKGYYRAGRRRRQALSDAAD
jgi:hypothetical protein